MPIFRVLEGKVSIVLTTTWSISAVSKSFQENYFKLAEIYTVLDSLGCYILQFV